VLLADVLGVENNCMVRVPIRDSPGMKWVGEEHRAVCTPLSNLRGRLSKRRGSRTLGHTTSLWFDAILHCSKFTHTYWTTLLAIMSA
jgi:hypothetical protein